MNGIHRRSTRARIAVIVTTLMACALVASTSLAASALAAAQHPDGSWSSQQKVPKISSAHSPATCTSGHTLYVAYVTSKGGIDYIVHTKKWSSKIRKVTGKGVRPKTTSAPAIIVYGGHLYVFWIDASGKLWYTDLAGKTWRRAKTVSGTWGTAESSTSPSLAVASSSLWVVWKGHATTNIYYSSLSGTSWSKQQVAVSSATSLSPAVAPTGLSAAPITIAWTTSTGAIGYGILGFLGFEDIGTVPQAGTNATPSLDFMTAAPGETMYLAWKGTSTNRVFFDEVTDFSASTFGPGTWAGQAALPSATTSTGPALTNIGTTLDALYKAHGNHRIWYEHATTPAS
jgi:hypothetical protein